MSRCVTNPLTGKPIQEDGPTYQKLVKAGFDLDDEMQYPRTDCFKHPKSKGDSPVYTKQQIKQMAALGSATPLSLEKELKRLRPDQRAKARGLRSMMIRGSRPQTGVTYTAGWKAAAPQRGRERHTVMAKCGSKCFLRPEDEGYPVCSKCDGDSCSCQVDCRGLLAAYRYAQKYGAQNIADAARQLALELNCNW